jgi:hypothetical protein
MGRRCLLAATVIAAGVGCGPGQRPPTTDAGSVVFEIEAVEATTPGRLGWRATYRAGGVIARFLVELQPEPEGVRLPAFVRCALAREPGSDASVLLRDLGRALGGPVPTPGRGVQRLDVPAVLLGRDLTRGGGGNVIAGIFGSEPKGDWIATKLFLGESEGEVFLNLDPVGGYGEFSLKDRSYGRAVLSELGRLLQGDTTGGVAATDVEPVELPTPTPTPDNVARRVAELSREAGPGVRQADRRQALESLARLGPPARAAIPLFLQALGDEDPVIRGEAVLGLPGLRPDPQAGAAAVRPLLKDPFEFIQVRASTALAEFGEIQVAANHLTVLLKGDSKVSAAGALARFGPEARSAVPLLIEMLENRESPYEGYWACRALAAIGRDASRALPALRAASEDVDTSVRKCAIFAVGEIEGH